MALTRLHIQDVRNLQSVKLEDLKTVNIFYGPNGSGKTSVLEAIHVLGMARSFRGASIKSLITHECDSCTVFGMASASLSGASAQALGVSRERAGGSQIKISGKLVRSVAQLVEHLPLQLINSDSFDLLSGAPNARRRFLNWGVFHVEHRFFGEWQRFQRCIKQRNVVLRRGKMSPELSVWTKDLASSGATINNYRMDYIGQLVPKFQSIVSVLMPYMSDRLELRYRRGWDRSLGYAAALEQSLPSDQEHGYTHVGPQRADIRVFVDGHLASDTLSRGQQKLVVIALKLAQGQLMTETSRGSCTYLVDDLPSELDAAHCQRVCEILSSMSAQVFVSCVELEDVEPFWPDKEKLGMFHVEQGVISRKKSEIPGSRPPVL
ncbi:MAG: DNA replication and repair protein RecF [Halioglobus sp.]